MQKYKNQRKVKDTCKLLNTNENISVYLLTTGYSYDLYFILHAVSSKNSDAKTTKNFCLTSC